MKKLKFNANIKIIDYKNINKFKLDKNCINLTKIIAKAKIENPSKTNITGPPFDIKSKLFRLFKFMNSSNSIKKHNN